MAQPLSTLRPEPLRPDDHVIGPDSASVTVIAYCDFECPFCGQAFVRTKRLRERFEHQLRLVYRHFPLIDRHPFAQHAAEASEAAAQQGRFWVMHDLLCRGSRLGSSVVQGRPAWPGAYLPSAFRREVRTAKRR